MAKKTESTAVNDLINLVATQGPSVKDPGADLFSEPPKKGARMTGTVPPLKGAGAVDPLPRTRAPAGTQQTASVSPPIRVSTAMPRANSIPPMPAEGSGRVRPALPPPRSSATMQRPPIPSSAKLAVPVAPVSLDPDVEVDVADDLEDDVEADLLKTPVANQPRAVVAPLTLAPEPVYPRAERTDHPNADMTSAAPWFDDSRAVERLSIPEASHSMAENTAQVQRRESGTVDLLKKLALPMGIAIVLGVFVGGYIVFDGQGGKKRAQAATSDQAALASDTATPASGTDVAEAKAGVAVAAAEPSNGAEPATEPTVEPPVEPTTEPTTEPAKAEPTLVAANVEPPKDSVLGGAVSSMPGTGPKPGKPVFVDVRIDSNPPGADVSLVDRGKTTFLGTTPIRASVDPSRTYDVIFTYSNKPPQIERLDPKATTRLAVTLGKSGNQAAEVAKGTKVDPPKTAKVAKVEAPKVEKPKAETKAEKKAAAPKVAKTAEPEDDTAALERKLAEKKAAKSSSDEPKAEAAVAKSEPKGQGTLMISSKPPCEIWIDGASTGLMTPQRAIPLAAGKHKITLVSPDKTHKKTIAVEITADKPTKVIQDLLK